MLIEVSFKEEAQGLGWGILGNSFFLANLREKSLQVLKERSPAKLAVSTWKLPTC